MIPPFPVTIVHRPLPRILQTRAAVQNVAVPARFLTLADVAETLAISTSQAYALVRSGELRAIKVGGRGQWRVEAAQLDDYIERMYAATEQYLLDNPAGHGPELD